MAATPDTSLEGIGDRIGRYKLLQKIGEGGCGVVYMAEQEEPVRRRVALKVIKLGMDTRSVIARFEAERQALALMDHPNIAKNDVRRLTSKSKTRTPEEIKDSSRRLLQIKELITLLRGDLDWIVIKCLEKDRSRRYETANGLAMDIQRHLSNEPIIARPPSQLYRFQKFARRNKLAFTAAAIIATVLVLGVVVSTWLAIRATKAERAQRLALYAADMKQAQQFVKDDNLGDALKLLEKHRPKRTATYDVRGFEWRYLWDRCQGESHVFLAAVKDRVMSSQDLAN